MAVSYRPAQASDLKEVATVFATAIDDLNKKHGFYDEPTPIVPTNYAFWLSRSPSSFWVAEDEGRIVGYSFSFVRGLLWFLADLFILPGSQGRGVGTALIHRTLGSWKGRQIQNLALITPAFNRASVSLYMRFGMLPRQPVYFADAKAETVRAALETKKSKLDVQEVEDIESVSTRMSRLHERALGYPPGWHNEFFSEVQKARCLLFKKRGQLEGYAFVRKTGRIGPLVVRSAATFSDALRASLRSTLDHKPKELTIFYAGTNGRAVSASVALGFRITYPLLFLSKLPMGDWENYLFYSPGWM